MSDGPEKLLIQASEAADLLGVSRTLFYEMQSSGRLGPEPIRLGRRTLWRLAELQSWVAAGCPIRDKWLATLSA